MIRTDFVLPGVQIQQNFLNTAPGLVNPSLPTVLIGPNNQVVFAAAGGTYTMGSGFTTAYPGLEFGAVVDTTSVAIQLTKVLVSIMAPALGEQTTFVADHAHITPAAGQPDFATTAVAPGDFLNAGGKTAVIVAVTSATDLQLDADLSLSLVGPQSFTITRANANITMPPAAFTATAAAITIATGLAVAGKPVFSARVGASYSALRQLTANRITVINTAADIPTLGNPDPTNPLALAAQVAKSNTVSSVLVCGISQNSPLGWLMALNFLENQPVYTVVALTQDPTIQGMVKTHVNQLSLPEKSKFRIGLANYAHPMESLIVQPLAAATLQMAAGVLTLSHPLGSFLTQALVGDYVKLTARTGTNPTAVPAHAPQTYRVLAIKNNNTFVLDNNAYAGGNGVYAVTGASPLFAADFTADFADMTVIRALDKDGQAMAIAQLANSINDRRITYITNHEVVVTGQDPVTGAATDYTVPGYYLAAAYGGMNAGNPPHQGFTNLGVVAIKEVHYTKDYFNDNQLKLIVGSGGFAVVQDVAGKSLPYVLLQTTTDNSSVLRQELSVTKTIDFYSIGLKARLKKYVGPYNNIASNLTALSNDITSYHAQLMGKSNNFDKIGTPITSGSIINLTRDPLVADTVIITTQIGVPTPINNILATVDVAS